MESKELMLGNWVKYAHNSFWIEEIQGQPVQIDIDNYQEIYFDEGGTPKYEPIVITPEILEMAGFEKVKGKDSIYRIGQIQLYHGIVSTLCYTRYDADSYCYLGRTIKYVHELQQLFFALTGTHLKIELK